jgi:hypothetical protein
LHEDKIHDAEQHLVSLKEIYYSLPAELVSYKLLLYNDILRMYEEVSIANRFEVLKSELDQLGSEIKLPPLSDLLYSPLASAINTSEDEIKKISEQEMSASSSEIGLEDNKTKPAETKEDDYLSVLPKVGVNTSDSQEHKNNDSSELKSKPEESSKKTLPLISEQPVQNKVDPSSVQEKDEGTSNSVVTNTTAKNSNNDTSTSTNSFDGVSSDAFSSLLSKENPMMKEAAEAYNEKDYEKAKRLFESILTTDPYNSKAKQMLSLTNGILSSSNQNLQYNEQDKTGVVPVR